MAPWLRRGMSGVVAGCLAIAAPAATIVSSAPEHVAVTVYRAPGRSAGGTFQLDDLSGFALVTETRRVRLAAGESTIRFEGVAGGIIPVSAIVSGLPGGVIQKNRDANLLSPAGLLRGSYGRRLTLRRTDAATGRVTEEAVTLVGGPAGGVVVRTATGVEALRCSGSPETLLAKDGVPDGLVPSPTLSVTTHTEAATTATVTLSYLAERFDWGANYVGTLAPDGRTIALSAWATLANGNDEGFADAETQLVAGTLARVAARSLEQDPPAARIAIGCWPMDTTHDGSEGEQEEEESEYGPPPPPPPPPPMVMAPAPMEMAQDIVVTAARVAQREELGDLKLYRVPERVTVAARGQKQVALIVQPKVAVERLYRFRIDPGGSGDETIRGRLVLRTKNIKANGLGLPLPGGAIAVMAPGADRLLLAGESAIRDVAAGEELEIALGETTQVTALADEDDEDRARIVLTNANAFPATIEVELALADGDQVRGASTTLGSKDGRPLWRVTVPANGQARLVYRVEG